MAGRIWDKGKALNAEVLDFTVGNDHVLDLRLLASDCRASAAHAKMLAKIGVLEKDELSGILTCLKEIVASENFSIPKELEDGHAAIEAYITEKLGEAGKKIHTGRSRNDQVLVALRLYMREQIVQMQSELLEVCKDLLERAESDEGVLEMPGYTHMQQAMPTSIGTWLGSYLASLLETVESGDLLLEAIDRNPLGAASGFGVPLELDRAYTAKLLGFSKVQWNPIDTQNSRGKYELKCLDWLCDLGASVERFAADFLLFSTAEFNFVSLPGDLVTGSSIMPQKENPDLLELMRANVARLRSARYEVEQVKVKLSSHYHRDYQLTKGPIIEAFELSQTLVAVFRLVAGAFSLKKGELACKSKTPSLYATYEAYKQVSSGKPFREAYIETAELLAAGEIKPENYKNEFELAVLAPLKKELGEAKKTISLLESSVSSRRKNLGKLEEEAFKS